MKKNKTAFISVCLSAIFSAVLIFGEDDRTSGGIKLPTRNGYAPHTVAIILLTRREAKK